MKSSLNYLKSLLEHSAAETIEGLQLTNANYDEAIKILKDRFGNQQIIINSHMEACVIYQMLEVLIMSKCFVNFMTK